MFYDYTLSKMIETITKDEINQEKKTYKKGNPFMGDIQPTTGQVKRSMGWGDDVTGELTLYTDENINIVDVVYFDSTYEIEKKAQWDYFIYSLKMVKVNE